MIHLQIWTKNQVKRNTNEVSAISGLQQESYH